MFKKGIISPIVSRNVKLFHPHLYLTFRGETGEFFPYSDTGRKMKTLELFATHPVFSLDEATTVLKLQGGRAGTVERLKYHVETGRLKLVIRGVYAVVPPGAKAEEFRPDPFLVAAAFRPEGVFSHHSALELLGVAHSVWNECTLYTEGRRRPLLVNGTTVRFLEHPAPMRTESGGHLGTRKIERQGKLLLTTGP